MLASPRAMPGLAATPSRRRPRSDRVAVAVAATATLLPSTSSGTVSPYFARPIGGGGGDNDGRDERTSSVAKRLRPTVSAVSPAPSRPTAPRSSSAPAVKIPPPRPRVAAESSRQSTLTSVFASSSSSSFSPPSSVAPRVTFSSSSSSVSRSSSLATPVPSSSSASSSSSWGLSRVPLACGPTDSCWLLVSPRLPPDLRVDASLFEALWRLHPEKYGTVTIAGKQIATPRWTQSYGESYTFSNETHDALPLSTHPFLQHVQRRVSEWCGCAYTQMLVNWYADGAHSIGWHADDEGELARPEWDPTAIGIWSFSYGAARHFDLRPRRASRHVPQPPLEKRLAATDNSCVVMMGATQRHYKHQVPKQLRVKARRINITLRVFAAPFLAHTAEFAARARAALPSTFRDLLVTAILAYVVRPPVAARSGRSRN